jgi:hypothetical protein
MLMAGANFREGATPEVLFLRILLLRLSEKGTNTAPSVDLAGMRKARSVEKSLLGGP